MNATLEHALHQMSASVRQDMKNNGALQNIKMYVFHFAKTVVPEGVFVVNQIYAHALNPSQKLMF